MTRHHHQSKEEQIYHKAHDAIPFHFEKRHYRANKAVASNDTSIQIRAYQIHREKDGVALDNWLEAEQSFKAV